MVLFFFLYYLLRVCFSKKQRLFHVILGISTIIVFLMPFILHPDRKSKEEALLSGFSERIQTNGKIEELRQWAQKMTATVSPHTLIQPPWPDFIVHLKPSFIRTSENSVNIFCGGHFVSWGIVIGTEEIKYSNDNHRHIIQGLPNAYLWCSLEND
jgi:hypothetical protein